MRRPARKPIFDDTSRALDRFGLLLTVTIASIVILMLVDVGPGVDLTSGRWESALASALVGVTLLLALRASGLARRWQRVADVVVIIVVVGVSTVALLATLDDNFPAPANTAPIAVMALAVVAPVAVMRRLAQHREVTRGTLLGAITGYLLLPIAFFYLFVSSTSLTGDAFFGSPEPTTVYMYFSLTTISTTGYGDYTAATEIGRTLATAEAVTGQIYLVTFVAMLVGLFISTRRTLRQSLEVVESPEDEG